MKYNMGKRFGRYEIRQTQLVQSVLGSAKGLGLEAFLVSSGPLERSRSGMERMRLWRIGRPGVDEVCNWRHPALRLPLLAFLVAPLSFHNVIPVSQICSRSWISSSFEILDLFVQGTVLVVVYNAPNKK
jgi:hypothetical protein